MMNALRLEPTEESIDTTLQFPLPPINVPVLIDNIFYEFDKATLTDESKASLDRLVKLLVENPNVVIELSSHCDYRGSDAYNQKLSQQRAQNVVDYLVSHGVDSLRLRAKGYGKQRPRIVSKRMAETYPFLTQGDTLTAAKIQALGAKEAEIANALNRRTAFRVLSTTYGLFDENGKLRLDLIRPQQREGEGDENFDEDFDEE